MSPTSTARAGKSSGEGLQHADGHSHLIAATNPAVVSYDPAFGFEIAHIMQEGLRRMYGESPEDVIFYMTVYNEPLKHPAEPACVDAEGILRGLYLYAQGSTEGMSDGAPRAQLLASGVAVPWALEAQALLRDEWGVVADVWSVTSWTELRRDAMARDEQSFLHPERDRSVPYVTQRLEGTRGPVVAVSDYMRQVQDQISPWAPGDFTSLGADGFGVSDTRPAARRFFHIDGPSIVVRTLQLLADRAEIGAHAPREAAYRYRLLDLTAGTSGTAGGDA